MPDINYLLSESGNRQTGSAPNAGPPVAPMPPPPNPNQETFDEAFIPDSTDNVATVPPPTRISMPELVSQPPPSTSQPVEQAMESGEELSGDEKPPTPPPTQH